jgi:hypothetical protein
MISERKVLRGIIRHLTLNSLSVDVVFQSHRSSDSLRKIGVSIISNKDILSSLYCKLSPPTMSFPPPPAENIGMSMVFLTNDRLVTDLSSKIGPSLTSQSVILVRDIPS